MNLSIGTIFSILPRPDDAASVEAMFLQAGRNQLAAGYVLYGPQTTLVLTRGDGANVFTLDRRVGDFVLTQEGIAIPVDTAEFAINASNHRHWPPKDRQDDDKSSALSAAIVDPRGAC